MSLTVVGLGTNLAHITEEGKSAIKKATTVIVKTSKSPSYEYFEDIPHETLDELFDNAENFDSLNSECADYILSKRGRVVYCTTGDGIEDGIVEELIRRNIEVKFSYGVSQIAHVKQKACTAGSFTYYTAYDIITKSHWERADHAVIIGEIDDKFLASDLKLFLLDKIGDASILFYRKTWKEITVSELDRQRFDHTATLVIPKATLTKKERFGFSDLVEIMKLLRAPDGCPWDREQTHDSIRKNLIEEAYELDEAIYMQDADMMCEECGDVLLQAVFNALISEDDGEFTLSDSLSMLCLKLINRHTHIFGDVKAKNAQEALIAWETAKKKEKADKGPFDTVPKALPALIRAQKVLKCAKAPKTTPVSPKTKDEWGDTLFELVKQMRNDGVDGEEALQDAIARFIKSEEEK